MNDLQDANCQVEIEKHLLHQGNYRSLAGIEPAALRFWLGLINVFQFPLDTVISIHNTHQPGLEISAGKAISTFTCMKTSNWNAALQHARNSNYSCHLRLN